MPAEAADAPSPQDQDAIKAIFMASSADRVCPTLRKKEPRTAVFLKQRHLSGDDIVSRYGGWSQDFATFLSRRFVDAPRQACEDVDRMIGEHGGFPELISWR